MEHTIRYIDGTKQSVSGKLVFFTDTEPIHITSRNQTAVNLRLVRSIETTIADAEENYSEEGRHSSQDHTLKRGE